MRTIFVSYFGSIIDYAANFSYLIDIRQCNCSCKQVNVFSSLDKSGRRYIRWLLVAACLLLGYRAPAQWYQRFDKYWQDSAHLTKNQFINNIFQQAINSIKKGPEDTTAADIVLNGKSEIEYVPYQGKIIRKINIKTLDFERTLKDTVAHIRSLPARVADAMHTNTRHFVIRNSLFIKENTPVNAFKIADNERYLRTLDYIHDARILIDTIPGNPDSVDVEVVTKDFFPILVSGASQGLNHVNVRVQDVNLAGMGQMVQLTGLYDYNRTPEAAYGGLYRKDNIGNSFINATVGYSTMNLNPYTREEDYSKYVSLDRPLVSPYSRFAGGFTASRNEADNVYHAPFTNFFGYRYDLIDGWAGYNIGINKLTATNNTIRDRRFFAIRYYNYQFNETPEQVGNKFDPIFNSKQAVLGTFTFFRQDYFKTQYIYGFGTTEDLPYGYNISVTAGWHKQLWLERPYAGLSALRYIATYHGDFIQLYFNAGGYYHNNEIEDRSLLAGATAYSRIFFWGDTKIRQYVNLSYSSIGDRITTAPLRIDNGYGIREFLSDSVYGDRRISLQLETEFYLKYKLLGFQFAPFPFADLSLVRPENEPWHTMQLYSGIGGGVRARNENLVFETIELRMFFYPVAPDNMRGFKVILTSNLRFRYNSNYITQPAELDLNASP